MSLSRCLPKALLASTAILIIQLSPAYADAKDDRIAAMEAQMRVMMEEMKAIKAERAAEKQEQTALRQKVKALEEKTENADNLCDLK